MSMNIRMEKEFYDTIARRTQKAFLDIQESIKNNTLNTERELAIKSLPWDSITGSADNRLRKFPNDCCMDAAIVLGIVFLALAEQNNFKYGQIMYLRCNPTEKTKVLMFDFHQWLRIDGYDIDITFEQCKTVLKGNEGKILFDTHPLIESDDYFYECTDATILEPFATFANFIITNYFRRKE